MLPTLALPIAPHPRVRPVETKDVALVVTGIVGALGAWLTARYQYLGKLQEREAKLKELQQADGEQEQEAIKALWAELRQSRRDAAETEGALRGRIDALENSLQQLRQQLDERGERITELEGKLAVAEQTAAAAAIISTERAQEILNLQMERALLSDNNRRQHEALREIRELNLRLAREAATARGEHFDPEGLQEPDGRGVMRIAVDGMVTTADAGADALFGEPVQGRGVLELIPPRFHAKHLSGFVRALGGEPIEHPTEMMMLRADGSELLVRGEIVTLPDRQGFRVTLRPAETETTDGN
jgi:hypothetical protein